MLPWLHIALHQRRGLAVWRMDRITPPIFLLIGALVQWPWLNQLSLASLMTFYLVLLVFLESILCVSFGFIFSTLKWYFRGDSFHLGNLFALQLGVKLFKYFLLLFNLQNRLGMHLIAKIHFTLKVSVKSLKK